MHVLSLQLPSCISEQCWEAAWCGKLLQVSPTPPSARKGRGAWDNLAMACSGVSFLPEVIIGQEVRHRRWEFGWKHVPSYIFVSLLSAKDGSSAWPSCAPHHNCQWEGWEGEQGKLGTRLLQAQFVNLFFFFVMSSLYVEGGVYLLCVGVVGFVFCFFLISWQLPSSVTVTGKQVRMVRGREDVIAPSAVDLCWCRISCFSLFPKGWALLFSIKLALGFLEMALSVLDSKPNRILRSKLVRLPSYSWNFRSKNWNIFLLSVPGDLNLWTTPMFSSADLNYKYIWHWLQKICLPMNSLASPVFKRTNWISTSTNRRDHFTNGAEYTEKKTIPDNLFTFVHRAATLVPFSFECICCGWQIFP